MTTKARARKRPLPVPLATSGGLAEAILQATITTADYIGTAPYGGTHGWARSHFLLVEISEQVFRQLCQHGAEQEDDEVSDGLQHDDCDAEDNGDDEDDAQRLPRHGSGHWVIFPKERQA